MDRQNGGWSPMPCPALPDGFDFTDPDLLHHRVPLPEFAELRRAEPVRWIPSPPVWSASRTRATGR